MRSVAFRFCVFLCAGLALGGCGRSASYRYKLTLSLDTPDGVKTGFNVVEIDAFDVIIPARGIGHKPAGQALYVDLGPGRRPLVALLTRKRRATDPWPTFPGWAEDAPGEALARQCLGANTPQDWLDEVKATAGCTKPVAITTADLPDLITFGDVNDPKSVMLVDADDLAATFGPGVSWRSMTLQATDEPLTKGIEKELPWIPHITDSMRLDGGVLGYGPSAPIANRLQRYDFSRFF